MSVVEYIYDPGGPKPSHCGYCRAPNTNLTEGVWAHRMTCEDYQDLVDRGFQRSGNYVYRAVNDRVCCPQYVIRLDVAKFRPSKSHRKVVKRFHKYVREGKGGPDAVTPDMNTDVSPKKSRLSPPDSQQGSTTKKEPHPGKGADPTKPKCRKAKEIRREKRMLKMAQKKDSDATPGQSSSMDIGTSVDKPVGTPVDKPLGTPVDAPKDEGATGEQDLLDLMTPPDPKDCVHKFEIKLVKSWPRSPELTATYARSYAVFKKFQTTVHTGDHDCNERHFSDFVVDSPLVPMPGSKKPGTEEKMPCDYGSYHQQYWLDGNLIGVALLDILPRMVVCEYFYYDPAYRFLSLGVYSAIREIAFVRELGQYSPQLKHYCIGFYVHSCPKMAYKSQYGGDLLCPFTMRYVPIERCIPKLEVAKYCKLGEGEKVEEKPLDLDAITVFYEMTPMLYSSYRAKYGDYSNEMLKDYGRVVGSEVGKRMKVNLTFY